MTEDRQHQAQAGPAGSLSAAAAARQARSRLTGLARASFQTQARLTKETVDLVWATVAGNLDRASALKAYVESVAREGAQYARTVGDLGVDYLADLVALGKSLSTTVLRETDQRWPFASRT